MASQSRIMRASDLALMGEPNKKPRSRLIDEKPAPVGPRQRMRDERLARCMAMTASIDETEDNALRCSISAQTGIVPSREEANWKVTSPAVSPVTSPVRPVTSSTASLEYLAGSPEHRVYDPTVPMEWGEEGPIMQHAHIGERFSFHQVANKRAELTQAKEGKRFSQNQLLAEVLAEAKKADEEVAEAALARKRAAQEREQAYAAKMQAAILGLKTPPEPEPECDQSPSSSETHEEVRLWRAPAKTPPRSWWPSAWVYGTDESVERVDEGEAATKKQHQRYYGKVHAGRRDVMPGLPPKTYNLIASFRYPERERMGRLDALRELPPGLRPENDTAVQSIRVRTPNSKYANEYSQVNSPAMTKRFIFRSEQRAASIHGIDRVPELPKEIAPSSNPVAVAARNAETEERIKREAQDLEPSGDCLLGYRPPSSGMVADGLHAKQADEVALRGFFQVSRDYANLPHRGCGLVDAAGSPRVDTTGYFPDGVKPAKMDGEPAQHAPTPAGGYYVSQAGVPMVGRVSGEAGVPRRDRPIGRQDKKTRRQDGRATLRGSQRWLGNRQGEYSFAKANADMKDSKPISASTAVVSADASSPAAPAVASQAKQQQDVSAAVSLPSEPSLLSSDAKANRPLTFSPMSVRNLPGRSPTQQTQQHSTKHADVIDVRSKTRVSASSVMRSSSVPLLERSTFHGDHDRFEPTGVCTGTGTARTGSCKVATPGGVAGRVAMGAVTKASLKKRATTGRGETGSNVSAWGDSGSLKAFNISTGSPFDSPEKHQADPAVRWYGKQPKNTAIARNQAHRGAVRQSL